MLYRPAFGALVGSLAYDLSPAVVAGVMTYFAWDSAGIWLVVMDVVTGLVVLWALLTTAVTFMQELYVDETGIAAGTRGAARFVPWEHVTSAVLRERQNVMTRTDRLLIIESATERLMFNISTLSPQDEDIVLEQVRAKTRLVVHRDKPAV